MAVSWVWAQMVRESKEGLDPHLLPFRIVVADVRIGSGTAFQATHAAMSAAEGEAA